MNGDFRAAMRTVVPEPWLQRIRAYRRAALFREAGVVFVHVPKAAGTSITRAIYGRFIGHFGIADVLASCPADVCLLPRFSMTRNPWDRLVSAWAFARAGQGKGGPMKVQIHRPSLYNTDEFTEFNTFVTRWLVRQDIELLDGVFRPQLGYLLDKGGNLALDHIGRVESISETEVWLSDRLGRPISFEHMNTSHHKNYREYYNSQTEKIVRDLYRSDIETLGYEF